MKLMIWIGITIGGAIGSWLGALIDDGNYFGPTSIVLGTIGSLAGILIAYKIAKNAD